MTLAPRVLPLGTLARALCPLFLERHWPPLLNQRCDTAAPQGRLGRAGVPAGTAVTIWDPRIRASVYPPSRPAPQEELESYPLGAIVRCDVVTLPGRSRSLLLLVCQEPERTQPDVHFFQGLRLGVSGPGSGEPPQRRAGTLRTPGGGAGSGRNPKLRW